MRITVFGAAGSVGSQAVAEALRRGHEVTAVVRDPARFRELPAAADMRTGDAVRVEDVIALTRGQDVVISSIRPASGRERELLTATSALLSGVARAGSRLLVVGGAATLTVPGTGGTLVLDDARFLPADYREIALACAEQFELCRRDGEADWTYLSPPALLAPGQRTGRYRIGEDELVVDTEGRSRISVEDLAVALLDEAERPRHRRSRFTVAY
ncbi:NAD(P)-dependent oxidoreductase [Qaidamihabitans albus]|uniref:NAD(P)-dependent oxidoreductase n=1 Tax=Qaidamihabitans albus TaxID=2795733 RepID=UPI0018F1D624|nr:NAD(P)H-binding protein [Qaidamihabitans albus]